jgi:hypothetical protein
MQTGIERVVLIAAFLQAGLPFFVFAERHAFRRAFSGCFCFRLLLIFELLVHTGEHLLLIVRQT